ncbi:sodium/solute symporter [Candidatus Sumerlaeota bacterium]|nr:sodium/solute symporter [Candidatus Sumerlaeota bacterium]
MNFFDWSIVGVYLSGLIVLALWLGRRQSDERDYYLGGNELNHWTVALSTMATQCSTNSLLGAPAFVIAVGGLLWLQYELAVPLAMIGVMLFLLPLFRRLRLISVYEYLGRRFGPGTRTLLSVLFQFLRAFSTGVTVYGIAIVLELLLHIPFWGAVLLLGAVTIIYDFLGGMKAVVYSDVIQMAILYLGIALCLIFAIELCGGWSEVWSLFAGERSRTLDFKGLGLGDGATYAFWPMLIGGFFLYMSYYGCDQTQVQRELSTQNVEQTHLSLFWGGLLRFPLVLTYCMAGVAVAAFIAMHPSFIDLLYDADKGEANYNLAVPVFCLNYLPHGVIGLIIVALFAAAMSSLDSTINSLSVVTMRDVIDPYLGGESLSDSRRLLLGRVTTIFWGVLCVAFSFFVGDISKSIIESINKIGSLANGPILATFLLGILTRRANGAGTVCGILAGFGINLALWKFAPGVSWLWWNMIGCGATFGIGYVVSLLWIPARAPGIQESELSFFNAEMAQNFRAWRKHYAILIGYFLAMLLLLVWIDYQ